MSEETFSVVLFFADGSHTYELRGLDAKTAVDRAIGYTRNVGAVLGTTTQVMIVDSGDDCVFLWEYGKGVTWPKVSA